jgi:hypothetical protein
MPTNTPARKPGDQRPRQHELPERRGVQRHDCAQGDQQRQLKSSSPPGSSCDSGTRRAAGRSRALTCGTFPASSRSDRPSPHSTGTGTAALRAAPARGGSRRGSPPRRAAGRRPQAAHRDDVPRARSPACAARHVASDARACVHRHELGRHAAGSPSSTAPAPIRMPPARHRRRRCGPGAGGAPADHDLAVDQALVDSKQHDAHDHPASARRRRSRSRPAPSRAGAAPAPRAAGSRFITNSTSSGRFTPDMTTSPSTPRALSRRATKPQLPLCRSVNRWPARPADVARPRSASTSGDRPWFVTGHERVRLHAGDVAHGVHHAVGMAPWPSSTAPDGGPRRLLIVLLEVVAHRLHGVHQPLVEQLRRVTPEYFSRWFIATTSEITVMFLPGVQRDHDLRQRTPSISTSASSSPVRSYCAGRPSPGAARPPRCASAAGSPGSRTARGCRRCPTPRISMWCRCSSWPRPIRTSLPRRDS